MQVYRAKMVVVTIVDSGSVETISKGMTICKAAAAAMAGAISMEMKHREHHSTDGAVHEVNDILSGK